MDTAEYELYYYGNDPYERENLAAKKVEVMERLKAILAKYPKPKIRGKREAKK